ncbi:MAG: hypothetical protein AB7O98_15560 [Hyphomonadaceae bacterium]
MSAPFPVDGLLSALAAQPRKSAGDGRAIMLVSPARNDAVTAAAAAVVQAAQKSTWYAIDLDLKRNALARALSGIEPLGPKIDGALNGACFFAARDAGGTVLAHSPDVFAFHRVGRSRAYAGVFNVRALPKGAKVVVSSRADYWNAARLGGASVVIEAPSLDRSPLGLRVAPHMDGVVLVVGGEPGSAPAAIAAKQALENAGANVMGLVYAGATAPVMAIERALRQAV